MALFQNYDQRIGAVEAFLNMYGISSLGETGKICADAGIDVFSIVRGVQPICFDDACYAYLVGAAAALKSGAKTAGEIALILGEGLQSFCIPGSVSSERQIGLGHGKLASMILSEDVKCFCFLAGHKSFAAAEGALGIARSANQARQTPIRVILNGMGKDAADSIARINGFTYVRTHFDFAENKLYIDDETPYSTDERADVRCYGAFEPREGIAIMTHE